MVTLSPAWVTRKVGCSKAASFLHSLGLANAISRTSNLGDGNCRRKRCNVSGWTHVHSRSQRCSSGTGGRALELSPLQAASSSHRGRSCSPVLRGRENTGPARRKASRSTRGVQASRRAKYERCKRSRHPESGESSVSERSRNVGSWPSAMHGSGMSCRVSVKRDGKRLVCQVLRYARSGSSKSTRLNRDLGVEATRASLRDSRDGKPGE